MDTFALARRSLLLSFVALAACSGDDDDADDQTPTTPTVVSTSPADGATDVDVDTAIAVTFSEAMSLSRGTVTLDPGGVVTGAWSAGGTVYTVSPETDLPAGASITVTYAGFTSGAFVPAATVEFTFTTAGTADTTAPEITSAMPMDTATDIATNLAAVTFTFSEAMDPNVGTATIDNGASLGAAAWSNGDRTVTFTPSGLTADTSYEVRLADFADVAGNALDTSFFDDGDLDFTTASGVDTEPPVVVSSVPAEGAADVMAGAQDISFTFDEAMDRTAGTATLVTTSTGASVTPVAMWSVGDTTVTYRVDLMPGVSYTLTLAGFEDIAGNPLNGTPYLGDGALDFATVADTTAPSVVRATPAEGTPNAPLALTTIEVEFDEAMAQTSSSAPFLDATLNASVTLLGTWSDAQTIEFDITGLLALGRDYRLDLRGFTDEAGNAVDPAPVIADGWLDFSTPPDTSAPAVVSTTPLEGDANVTPNLTSIVVTFDEAIDPTTIAASLDDGTSSAALTGSLSADQLVVTYDVSGQIVAGNTYRVDLTGITDLVGNALDTLPVLGDGILDFTVPLPPTGFDCSSPLTIGYASSVVGGTYRFDLPAGASGSNGSFACDDSGVGDDFVFRYDKQSDTLANGGELLHVSAISGNATGFNVEVLSGACSVQTGSTQHHCYWNKTDLDVFLDVPAGTYWIWVGRNTGGTFQGGTVEIDEVPPTAAEGESCWLPWDTNSSIYTAPATANDPHVWTIPATAVNAFDMDVTWGGIGSISCDDHPTYGDIHGVDTVVEYTRTSTNALVIVDVTAGTGSNDSINVELLDRCESRDPARMSLACEADLTTTQLVAPPGPSSVWIWLSTEATSDDWPGATVEVREIVPALGESCATARPIGAGTTTLNPTSTANLGAPACFASMGSVEWYRYTVVDGRVQITGNANSEIGVIDAADSSVLGCSATPASLGFGRSVAPGTDLCVAVPVGTATELTIVDAADVYTGVGTNTATVAVMPATSWNTDYWMAASPSWVYFGRSGGDVQRFANPVQSSTIAVQVFSGSTNVGYAAVASSTEELFSLDNTTSSSNNRLFRLWDGTAATYSAQPWDLTPSYPTQDMRALTFDGTDLVYATHATNNVEIFSVPVAAAQSPTQLGTNTTIDNVYGIAADQTYLYFTAISVADNVDGLYRLPRSELGDPNAVATLLLPIDVGSTVNPIYLDDPIAPQYLYVRSGNPSDIHVVELPDSTAPIYRGTIARIGNSADYAWTYDAASNTIYLYETETDSAGRIVRVF